MAEQFTPDFSRLAAYPELAAPTRAIRDGDWPAFRASYDAAPDWAERCRLIRVVDDVVGAEEFMRTVLRTHPDDVVATTMLARRLHRIGWNIRTGARGKHVSATQFEAFWTHLRESERLLNSVCTRAETFVPAWVELLITARGLQLPAAQMWQRYEHVVRLDPHNCDAAYQVLQRLCPKWGGKFQEVHRFAQRCAAQAPAGAPDAQLVVIAHIENWLELGGGLRSRAYLRRQGVRTDVAQAAHRSVLHPDFRRTGDWVETLSVFALGLSVTGEWSLAKRCFTALGHHACAGYWDYWTEVMKLDATGVFLAMRAQAMDLG